MGLYDNLSLAEQTRRVRTRTHVMDKRPTYTVYAWKGDDAIHHAEMLYSVPEAAAVAGQMAADYPHHKVCIYKLEVVIEPDEMADPAFNI